MQPLPPQSKLHHLFDYREGQLLWARNKGPAKKGDIAGAVNGLGYRQTKIDGTLYMVHRLVWLYVTGEDPTELTVDHIDGDKLNNSWENLRLATMQQQGFNVPSRKGVYKQDRVKRDRWSAVFRHNHLGCFDSEEKARAAYLKAYQEYAGAFAHKER